ncbi:MAG: 2-C-methyl-D-erythritol 4-phosphate cytidylyltransferase [Ginsengibacter sp.]
MKKYAVIVAGGKGSRMNTEIPKQFLILKDKPVLFYTMSAFLKAYTDMKIILVLPLEHMGKGQEIIDGYFEPSLITVVAGGRTRFHSVQNGLANINDESIIFVHDGVRCLVTENLIHRAFEGALETGSAIPVIDSVNSVRLITEDGNVAVDRSLVKLVQTPQTFHSKILLEAYKIDYKDKFTDEASVVEAFGLKVNLIEGEVNNIKITELKDLAVAENILDALYI